jgi:hypothetical protein
MKNLLILSMMNLLILSTKKFADLVDESLKDPARMPNPVVAIPTVGAN